MATPAVRAVRERFPAAHIVGVGKPYIAGVFDGSAWLDEWVPCDPRGPASQHLLPVAARLRKEPIDLAVLFPNSFRVALAAWLGRCKRRVGYARYGRSWLLTERLQPLRDVHGQIKPNPALAAYNRLAVQVGCPRPSNRMELFTTPADETQAERVWRKFRLERFAEVVCLNPGAAFGSAKLWPADYFAWLARQLMERRGTGILILCGPTERQLARKIALAAKCPGVYSLADEPVSLGLTKASIRRADLLVSTDSGPRHFAAALNRPVVALFGPTHIAWTQTHYSQEIQMQESVPCGPCQQRVCHLDHRCMTQLLPQEVFDAAVTLLERRQPEDVRHAG